MKRADETIFERKPEAVSESSDSDSTVNEPPHHWLKSEERGLSELVKQCLGKPLDKRQQMSDWETRPLRQAQITYAGNYCSHIIISSSVTK